MVKYRQKRVNVIKVRPLIPNQILVKTFDYLDIHDISRCAKVSRQFNGISEDLSLWRSCNEICIKYKKVPSEFILKIFEKGVKKIRGVNIANP